MQQQDYPAFKVAFKARLKLALRPNGGQNVGVAQAKQEYYRSITMSEKAL